MTVTWREEFLTVDGVKLHCLTAGDGPPLLILHGVDGWDGLQLYHERLAESFRVIAPSLPGFGRSEFPEWLDSMDDLAYFSLDLIKQLDLTDLNVLGIGFGGWLAAEVAVHCQDRLRRLVLADAVGIKVGDRERCDVADIFVLTREEFVRLTWHDPKAGDAMKFPGAPGLTEEELTAALRALQTASALGWKPFMHNPKLLRRLKRIKLPTLVLWGESDRVVSPDYGRAYHQAIPGSTFELIFRAGHFPHRERPDDFASAVTGFLIS
jgi:pimeloyl-ACP methyl ester carboxylesterase